MFVLKYRRAGSVDPKKKAFPLLLRWMEPLNRGTPFFCIDNNNFMLGTQVR
jgi:hypothetical protein